MPQVPRHKKVNEKIKVKITASRNFTLNIERKHKTKIEGRKVSKQKKKNCYFLRSCKLLNGFGK